jgi:hypothetical protein
MKMLRIEAGAADGTALGKTRRTNRLGLVLDRTLGVSIGTSFTDMTDIQFRTTNTAFGHAPELFTGVITESLDADYDFDNNICIRQSQPLPGTILAVMPGMTTQDR